MSDKLRAAAKAALETLDCGGRTYYSRAAHILRAALAEQTVQKSLTVAEQEPVGKFSKFSDGVWKEVTTSSPGQFLYTAPPRKEWVGLTDDDIGQWIEEEHDVLRWAEAKLKERNT